MPITWFVRAKQPPGFRRAGHYFPYEGKTLTLSELTDAEREAIAHEPRLVVGEPLPETPATPDPLIDDIVEVIGMLDDSKKPSVKAIEAVLEKDISAAQRDTAWRRYQDRLKEA
ncbi:hypothetical protein K6Q96_08965 [Grimontia kaedaensis]|uniref:Mu-like prophage FluMu N-terminal domain-containing protein n=1 Tax=Grimontia kaedaensis TaxID=2872157 RepID=A0ABY4WRW9_9GAMM|nr:hypothetical protein [Grimontia kaedaensis]USH01071.1 hypothetical protein K6Q96_08965 [Grimontia kaedaensis]